MRRTNRPGSSPRNTRPCGRTPRDETVTLLKAKLKAAAAPDRRDRVELIGIAYHWPNIGLIHDFDHLFGHNPLRLMDFERATAAPDTVAGADQRQFPPLMSSYRSVLDDLFGVRFIAIGVPIEQIDTSLKPGRSQSHCAHQGRLCLRKSAGAAARDAGDGLAQGRLRRDDPRRRLAGRRSAPHGAARRTRRRGAPDAAGGGTARIVRYHNTDIAIEADAPGGGIPRAQRRLASVVAGERRWQAGGHPQGQCAVPRRRGAARQAHRALHLPSILGRIRRAEGNDQRRAKR